MTVKIEKFISYEEQMCNLGSNHWSVARLVNLSKDLIIMDVPLTHLNMYYLYKNLTLRDMVMHMKAVLAADMSKPLILDEDGELMDGRHRLMSALLSGAKSIKVVRFSTNPSPCKVEESS